jgi:hypothetical protein
MIDTNQRTGYAYVFTLPYWIFIEADETWVAHDVKYKNLRYRIYAPHRHSQMPFLNTPTILNINQVPGLSTDKHVEFEPSVIAVPTIGEPLKMQLFWPGGPHKVPPHLIPKDSVRIDIFALEGNEFHPNEADRFLKQTMEYVRWRTKQWWIGRSSTALFRLRAFPFPIHQNGALVKRQVRMLRPTTISTIYGNEVRLSKSTWEKCLISAVSGNEQIPIYDTLIAEAKYFAGSGDIRQSILEASSAVDICKEIAFRRLWLAKNPGKEFGKSRRDKTLRNWDCPRHLDNVFIRHFGRSYKREHPEEWFEINRLWEARNNIAHGGPTECATPPVTIDWKACRRFVEASMHCLSWLISLPAK